MDTSEKYIKMCEKAEEIQKLKHPKWSFIQFIPLDSYNSKEKIIDVVHWSGKRHFQEIWLPRQDQLQEMINFLDTTPPSMFDDFVRWGNDPWGYGSQPFRRHWKKLEKWGKYIDSLKTPEQFLLAYVMWNKFDEKTWNDEKERWVYQNENLS